MKKVAGVKKSFMEETVKKNETNVDKIIHYLEQGLSYGSVSYLCATSRHTVIEVAQSAGLDTVRR